METYGDPMEIPWRSHGDPMWTQGDPWRSHGDPWRSMEIPCGHREIPWRPLVDFWATRSRIGNLAPPGRIRPPRESSFFRSCGPHLEVRRRDSVKVPKWVRADTVWSTPPVVRDTLLRCDCRQGSRETVRREGMSTRKARDEMIYDRTARCEGMRWR